MPRSKLKIMVSSTVYGAESDLNAIHGMLKAYGYEVIMSMEGTLYVPTGVSNEEACLQAVEDCDLFFGIIFPRYGSGITHKEFNRAIDLDKPRWFASHHYIPFARELMRQYMFRGSRRNRQFKFKETGVLDNTDVIHMYNDAIQHGVPLAERKSNWAQPFFNTPEIFPFVETQFSDMKRRIDELKALGL